MVGYLGRRIALLVPTLLGVSVLAFSLIHLVPGDPAAVMLGERANARAVAELRHEMGLDRPLPVQYWIFLTSALEGDLGRSIKTREKVSVEIAHRFPATFELALAAMLIAVGLGVPLGVLAARRRGGWLDAMVMTGSLVGVSLPIFWLGLLLLLWLSVGMGWFPLEGRADAALAVPAVTGLLTVDTLLAGRLDSFVDALKHLVLPALALGTIPLSVISRITRSSVLEVLRLDFVRTAWAKGLAERVVLAKHVLKNAFIPVLTVIGLQFGYLLGGAIITETIFAWPGLGRWLLLSVQARDFRAVQGGVMLVALVFVIVNLVVDVLYAFIDPRIRLTPDES
ncbi:MAG TPA: ABC transporter permease [Candidatus Eisenbacteria bacterium]|nr:ABC transporter permease [Candidatus Eisenbacteria bacterium]